VTEPPYPSVADLVDGRGILQPFERLATDLIRTAEPASIERTRDVIQINCEPAEIGPIILVTPDAVDFRLPTLAWSHPGIPSPSSISWRRIDLESAMSGDPAKLIRSARSARKRQFQTCRYCGLRVPPEHRHGKELCHGCASEHYGIVY
jgi:hypothetical protein